MTSGFGEISRTFWTGPAEDPTRFRVEGVRGELLEYAHGGEGLVFHALRSSSTGDSWVALKLLANAALSDYPRVHDRSLAIGEAIHPNIMRQEETFVGSAFWSEVPPGEDDYDLVFCVAQWIDGESLHDAMEHAGVLQELRWVCQIAQAVQFLHNFRSPLAPRGIIHRDIKPSNIRIRADGQAVLIDFGMSRPNHGSDLTGGAGTFLWMAPEAVGESPGTGPESDVWGVGALAHWVVTGKPPRFDDSTTIRRQRIREKCHSFGFRSSRSLSRLIASLLEVNPQRRPTDLLKWVQRVDRVLLRSVRREQRIVRSRRFSSTKVVSAAVVMSSLAMPIGVWTYVILTGRNQGSSVNIAGANVVKYFDYHVVIPGSSIGQVSEYDGPSTRSHVTGSLNDGSTIFIACQTSGSEVGYPQYTVVWDRLKSGNYVSDFFTNTPIPYRFSHNIPRCTS